MITQHQVDILKHNLCIFSRCQLRRKWFQEVGLDNLEILTKEGYWQKSTWGSFEEHMRYRLRPDYQLKEPNHEQ